MASLLSLSFALALLESLAQASLIQLPRATPVTREVDPKGWTPRPTTSPLLPPELLRRAYLTNAAQYVLIAPDRTCGYISGSTGADFDCPSSTQTCVFFPVTGTSSYGAVGCCTSIDTCYIRTKCIDARSYSSLSACDDACRFDANTLKCTASASPYCGSIRYPQASAQDYYCDSVSRSTWLSASTTYNGETGRTLSSSSIDVDATTSISSSTSQTSSTSTISSAGSASSTTHATAPVPTTKTPVPVGAIVGGVIGGLAVICLFALAALFILKKYGQKPQNASPSEIGLNDHDNGPSSAPIEIGGNWRDAAAPAGYYKPQSQAYDSSAQYQPIVAEMAVPEEYVYVEKPARELEPVPFYLGSPNPNRASVAAVSPASTGNRNSTGPPDFTASPDLRQGQ